MSGKCDELKDKWFNAYPEIIGIEGDELTQCYGKADVDAAIDELKTEHHKERHECIEMVAQLRRENAELKAELEDAKATAYADSVDAGMRERRLRRALYKACANWAHHRVFVRLRTNEKAWENVESKCLKKAEQYK